MDLSLLETTLRERDEPAYRAGQVWEWAARGAEGYAAMTNLPRELRDELVANVPFSTLTVETQQESRDGTVKTLFRTSDGHPVEAVLMRYRDGRRTLCLSSQSGCPLTCTFCATGQMAFGRNLTASEILDQVLHFRRIEPVNHLVFMGMGEPMFNVDEVDEPIRLALSLHAPNAALRGQLMPVNDRYPLHEVLAECRRYFDALYLPLVEGENELVVAVAEDFGGWGIQARFEDPSGLALD
jgi:23S rRNA (adenine2503-C2)-methyltransferase